MLGAGGEEGPRSLFLLLILSKSTPLSLSLSLRAVRHYAHSNNTIIAHLVYMLDTRLLLNSVFQFNFTLLPSNICAAQMNQAHSTEGSETLGKRGHEFTSRTLCVYAMLRCYCGLF